MKGKQRGQDAICQRLMGYYIPPEDSQLYKWDRHLYLIRCRSFACFDMVAATLDERQDWRIEFVWQDA
jgi:hypothetical protein